ncbi:MAG TPA: DUF6212 domain-containing protein [Aliidongia sp.]|nr:DUF6212 domain-containing protein [Aliidongia sp.]
MLLEVSAPSLSALMAPQPKIITGEADAVHWRKLVPPQHLEIFTFGIGEGQKGRLKRLSEGGATAPASKLPYAPNACMALVSMSDAADEELSRLEDWWKQVAPDGRPSFGNRIQIRDWSKEQGQFFASLCERLVEQQTADARRIVQLQRELAALRGMHEEAQITFSQLSDYIAQVHLPEEQLLYSAEPSHIAIYPQGKERFRIEQLLPVPSLGLAAVELHVHSAGIGDSGRLQVTLSTLEDSEQLAVWSLRSAQLKPGWLRLDLPHAVVGPRRTVVLSVRWEGGPKSAPSLSLTDQRLVKECWLKVNDTAIVQRTVALRAWSGLPGLRRTRSARQKSDPAVAGQGLHLERRPVSAAVRRGAKLVAPAEKVVDYDLLAPINDQGVFQLHPVEDHVAVAMIPSGCPADARQLFATVKTNHPDAQPIEYAMMVLPPGTTFDGFPNSGSDAKTGNFSGWTLVPPNSESGVTVFMDRTFPVDADLYVATRVPPGKSNAFAWAWWLDFAALVG